MAPHVLPMSEPHPYKSRGWRRLIDPLRNSYLGFLHGIRHEVAVRYELIVMAILVPVAAILPVSRVEQLILVLTMMLVLLAELINSAIEATIDRISLERHPLAGRAKDLGSAAVCVAVLMMGLAWLVIAGPVVAAYFQR